MAVNLKPLNDRVVVRPKKEEEKTKSGIYLPSTASKERPTMGEIIAVGSGKLSDKGERVPMEVKVGDTVVYSEYAGTELKYEEEKYLIMREDDILAIA
jgi:chaperonin GroES